jgi:hypothetical protein
VVKHSPQHLKVEGFNPTPAAVRERENVRLGSISTTFWVLKQGSFCKDIFLMLLMGTAFGQTMPLGI